MSQPVEISPNFTKGDEANQAFLKESRRLLAADPQEPEITSTKTPRKLSDLLKSFLTPHRARQLMVGGASGLLTIGAVLFPGGSKEAIAADSQAGYTVVKDDWNHPPDYSVTQARMGWVSPHLNIGQPPYTCSSSIWPGIANSGGWELAQAGEIFQVSSSGFVSHTAFTEVYPDEPSSKGIAVTIREGDTIGALVKRDTDGKFTLGVKNFTTGQLASRTRYQSANRANQAQFRAEKTITGGTDRLCNFGTLTVKYADATISGFKGPLDSLGWLVNRENMDVGTTILATTSSLTRVTLQGNQGNSWNFGFVAPS